MLDHRVLGALLTLISPVPAQSLFLRGSPRPLTESLFHFADTAGFVVADFDLNGWQDIYLCNRAVPSRLVLGRPELEFDETPLSNTDGWRRGGAAGDLNGDGRFDIVFTSAPNLAFGDGRGGFSVGNLPTPVEADCVVVADVDRDGDLDIYFGLRGAQNRLFMNQGGGIFVDASATHLPQVNDATVAAAFVDVDRDGDPDIVAGNANEQSRMGMNDGSGRFLNVTASNMPPASHATNSIGVGDVDRDGDPDLVIGVDYGGGATNQLYLNDGGGRFFADATGRLPGWNGMVALIDVDGDGAIDVLSGSERTQPVLFRNGGAGTFVHDTSGRIPAMTPSLQTMLVTDLDRDGRQDLLIGCKVLDWAPEPTGRTLVLLNRGGRLEEKPQPLKEPWGGMLPAPIMRTNTIIPLDSDRDGDIDLIFSNDFQSQNRYFRNDGNGVFVDDTAAKLPLDQDNSVGMAAGDVDGDGLPDLVISNYNGQARLYRGRVDGGFTDATPGRMPRATLTSYLATLVDIDRDADLDILLGTDSTVHIYVNDGQGFFVEQSSRWNGGGGFQQILAADFDGDGDIDVATCQSYDVSIHRNVAGAFSSRTSILGCCPAPAIYNIAAFDAGSDGDQDLLIFNTPAFQSFPTVVRYDNQGNGSFVRGTPLPSVAYVTGVASADLDGDGTLDFAISSAPETFVRPAGYSAVHYRGGLGNVEIIEPSIDGGRTVSTADLDGDGDMDVIVGNKPWQLRGGQSRIYANLTRHVSVPEFSRVGGTLRVLTHAAAHRITAGLQTTTFASLGLASSPITLPPYGTLRIDPASAITLSSGLTTPSTRAFETNVPIPPDTGLRGASIYLQAIVEGRDLSGQPEFRFTNALRETLR